MYQEVAEVQDCTEVCPRAFGRVPNLISQELSSPNRVSHVIRDTSIAKVRKALLYTLSATWFSSVIKADGLKVLGEAHR